MAPKAPPPSTAPAGVPSGNGKYIAIALLLLGVVGAAIVWKVTHKPEEQPPTVVVVDAGPPVATNTGRDQTEDISLPPPIVDAGEKKTTVVSNQGGGAAGCEVKSCGGRSTSELETALSFRSRQAHRCYDNALTQDPTLRGKITISVRVGSNGITCPGAVNVVSNEMNSSTVASCVMGYYRGQNFPAPSGGCLDATIPINFVPKQ
jgi:hypothetical protein